MSIKLNEHIRSILSTDSPGFFALHSILSEVFKTLAERGVLQLFAGLKDSDEGEIQADVRKLSARLLCELAFQNEEAQMKICEMFEFTPVSGKVCISSIPTRVQSLLSTKKDLLSLLKKPVSESKRYWCFPPLDTDNYKASLDHFTLFPDPEKFAVGFVVTTGKATVSPKSGDNRTEKEEFLNTTTSYLSEDLSSESFRSTSPYCSKDYTTERRTEVKSLTEKRPALRAYVPQVPPLRFKARPSASPVRTVLTDRTQRSASPVDRTFQSIEASIQRIRGCLSRCRPVLHALNARKEAPPPLMSPVDKDKGRRTTPNSTRFRMGGKMGFGGKRDPKCDTDRSPTRS